MPTVCWRRRVDVEDDIPRAEDIVGIAEKVLDQMSPF